MIEGDTSEGITNCYYLEGTVNNISTTGKIESKTEEQMKSQSFVTQLNAGGSDWTYFAGNYPKLSWE